MLAYARKNNAASNIEYRRLAFEELDDLEEKFDVITSSLAFDYVENFERLMKQIYSHLNENGKCVFSMSHPISTAYDGTFDRYTRTETGERLYANLRNYGIEGKRVIHWVVDEYELYHRTISTLINDIVSAGFIIEECQESKVPESIREKRGYFTYNVSPGEDCGYICPVCFWENDPFIASDDEPSDSNHGITLNEAKFNYLRFGACEEGMLRYVRPPQNDEKSALR